MEVHLAIQTWCFIRWIAFSLCLSDLKFIGGLLRFLVILEIEMSDAFRQVIFLICLGDLKLNHGLLRLEWLRVALETQMWCFVGNLYFGVPQEAETQRWLVSFQAHSGKWNIRFLLKLVFLAWLVDLALNGLLVRFRVILEIEISFSFR